MKTIIFRPLRLHKKSGKIMVASYMLWNKVKCANYNEFTLKVMDDYKTMPLDAFVHDHTGELLYHYNYNPWDAHVHYGSCIEDGFDWDFMRAKYKSFSIDDGGEYISYHWKGADCCGTPTFSHLTAEKIINGGTEDMFQFEPLTVGYVIDWLGWFLYQLENSRLQIGK